jgi:hypothetical protein
MSKIGYVGILTMHGNLLDILFPMTYKHNSKSSVGDWKGWYSSVFIFISVILILSITSGGVTTEGQTYDPITGEPMKEQHSEQHYPPSTQSRSSGIYWDRELLPVIIDKYTKTYNFNKNENITIILKVVNLDLDNKLKNIYIREEIPEGFCLVKPKKNLTDDGTGIKWNCDWIGFTQSFEYILRSNKKGVYNLGRTVLKATRIDNEGRQHEIGAVSDKDLFINIINNKPKIKKIDPPSPMLIKIGSPLLLNVTVEDPDNDTMNCTLKDTSNEFCINPILDKGKNYTWNLANYAANYTDYIFELEVKDSDEDSALRTIELRKYWLTEGEIFGKEILALVGSEIFIKIIFTVLGAQSSK